MLFVSLLALASFQAGPAAPPTVLTLTVQKLPSSFRQNPVVTLTFDGKGAATGCKTAKTSGSTAIDRVACTQAQGNVKADPVADGAPSTRDVTVGFEAEAPKG
ncbi:hypothetical protein [Sphingomonas sp.]|uniref:hypothetical protein n=1 Tax=Sphingomonas sp. TaxID=28214 RepID=UPI002EDAAB5F